MYCTCVNFSWVCFVYAIEWSCYFTSFPHVHYGINNLIGDDGAVIQAYVFMFFTTFGTISKTSNRNIANIHVHYMYLGIDWILTSVFG